MFPCCSMSSQTKGVYLHDSSPCSRLRVIEQMSLLFLISCRPTRLTLVVEELLQEWNDGDVKLEDHDVIVDRMRLTMTWGAAKTMVEEDFKKAQTKERNDFDKARRKFVEKDNFSNVKKKLSGNMSKIVSDYKILKDYPAIQISLLKVLHVNACLSDFFNALLHLLEYCFVNTAA